MTKPLRIGMVAGEKSGDNLGAGFIREMLRRQPAACFEGIGGPAMMAEGFNSLFPMERLSVMGFVEPLSRLPELLAIDRGLRRHFLQNPPDVFIGIDSPGFNTRFERSLHRRGLRTVHYVSPSVWAYGENRIRKIKEAVDLMLVLFPFEESIYQVHDIPVSCVGHPLADDLHEGIDQGEARHACGLSVPAGTKLIALLPGSRVGEVSRLAPVFLEAANRASALGMPVMFVLPCASPALRELVEALISDLGCQAQITLLDGKSQLALRAADLVLLASGTATLESLLLGRPMAIAYKVAPVTYLLASRLLKIPYVGLPNLLAGERLVPEYLQHDATPENLLLEIQHFLADPGSWDSRLAAFRSIRGDLARHANAKAVDAVLDLLGGP